MTVLYGITVIAINRESSRSDDAIAGEKKLTSAS
jgi:hypothetical protein